MSKMGTEAARQEFENNKVIFQSAITALFAQESHISLFQLQENCRCMYEKAEETFEQTIKENFLSFETFSPIYNHLKNVITLASDNDEKVLTELSAKWIHFYSILIPQIQSIFIHIKLNKSIRVLCYASFRDHILLREDSLSKMIIEYIAHNANKLQNSYPKIQQMLQILINYPESDIPSENYLKLEKFANQYKLIDNFYASSKIQFSKAEIESELQKNDESQCENQTILSPNLPTTANLTRSLSKKSSFKEKLLSPFLRKNKP